MIKINPCKMTDKEKKILLFFLQGNFISVMKRGKKYSTKIDGKRVSFKLKYTLILRPRKKEGYCDEVIDCDSREEDGFGEVHRKKEGYRYEVIDCDSREEGGFGEVHRILATLSLELARINNGKRRVVKTQEKTIGETESEYSRYALHLHAKPCIFDEKKEKAYMVLREMPGKNLQKILAENKLTFGEKLQLAVQLINAYQEQVRKPGFVHRDVKPGNIMVDLSGKAMVDPDDHINNGFTRKNLLPIVNFIDFGLAKWQMERDKQCVGSFNYMAPEVLTSKGSYTASDIYGLGCILIRLFADEEVFSRKEKKQLDNLFKKVMKDKDVTQEEFVWRAKLGLDKIKLDGVPPDIKEKLIDTISRMIEVDPVKRISLDLCFQEIQTLHNKFLMKAPPVLPKQEKRKKSIISIKGMKNIFFSCLVAQPSQPQPSQLRGCLQRSHG